MGNNQLPTILKRQSDFQNLKNKGQRVFPCHWMIVNYTSSETGETRYGWTISKYVGNAVARNRFKRWCREFIRHNSEALENSHLDVNFVLRKKDKDFYKQLSHQDFQTCFETAFLKLKKRSAVT
ncbi:MAG: ribonuclease P protein component [Bdellovibrionales bacterium]|nr:ribonuclease P protein component [Bdellovibrionales bacterium]